MQEAECTVPKVFMGCAAGVGPPWRGHLRGCMFSPQPLLDAHLWDFIRHMLNLVVVSARLGQSPRWRGTHESDRFVARGTLGRCIQSLNQMHVWRR
jgi:hypothetical protein